jgi:hypothetical protein
MQFTSILALSATLLGAVHGSSIPQHEVREVNVSPREIHAFWKGDVAWYGEKVSFIFPYSLLSCLSPSSMVEEDRGVHKPSS